MAEGDLVAPAAAGCAAGRGDLVRRPGDDDGHHEFALDAAGLVEGLLDFLLMVLDEGFLEREVAGSRVIAAGDRVEGLQGVDDRRVLLDDGDIDQALRKHGVLGEKEHRRLGEGGGRHGLGLGGGLLGGVGGDGRLRRSEGGDADEGGEHEQDAVDMFHGWVCGLCHAVPTYRIRSSFQGLGRFVPLNKALKATPKIKIAL